MNLQDGNSDSLVEVQKWSQYETEHEIQLCLEAGDLGLAIERLSKAPLEFKLSERLAFDMISKAAILLPSSMKQNQNSSNPTTPIQNNKKPLSSASIATLYQQLRDRKVLTAFNSVQAGNALTLAMMNDTKSTQYQSQSATGSNNAIVPKLVDVEQLERLAELPVTALAPKKVTGIIWQIFGVATVIGINLISREFGVGDYFLQIGIGAFAAWIADQILLRGMIFESVYRFINPQLSEKVLIHEAGHFLVAYLLGACVQGYVLSSFEAFQLRVPGQAGTVFSDMKLETEMKNQRLTSSSLERFAVILMGGIAAEALRFGQAEGGKSDEEVLIQLLGGAIRPVWPPIAIINYARWAALDAILLLRSNQPAYDALVDAMRARKSLGECIRAIEKHAVKLPEIPSREEEKAVVQQEVEHKANLSSSNVIPTENIEELDERIKEIERRLKEISD
eukprot:CAMPEP_0182445964 /NCGR_PEP_ID=MMETSP1172-20130603/3897_1 /TAXON_ID=708627 /ORGANISM="Timspurckia oligopyrenoides, Strain CCMP3278" /LENGTH=449 /DNA_ID=CAMNT_0024641811 /DNA_START=336 /DNA_END=1685 /DNA_ORIENTATION=+